MSRSRSKNLPVALCHSFTGPVGTLIESHIEFKRDRLQKTIQRRKDLGPVPDSEVVLEEHPDLKNLDPNDWKDQDHYSVLGLPKLRHRATDAQIKKAYRKSVLKHHPDKRRRAGENMVANECDDYFTCITRAYETLGNTENRRAYDSIDPNFNDDIPTVNKTSKENFYDVFGPVFERNQRWSVEPNVPFLGDEYSPIDHVNRFYNFWYDFNSWREYSYLDEENKEKAEDAYERRWMEKQNRAARAEKKKEEMSRIRSLVDNAYACDPRIRHYKEEEKRKKAEEKAAKALAAKLAYEKRIAEEEEQKRKEEEEKRREEEAKKNEKANAKKQKEREKKQTKRERSKLLEYCKKQNYFTENDSERIEIMDRVNHLCTSLQLLQLKEVNQSIERSTTIEESNGVILSQLDLLQQKTEEEKHKLLGGGKQKKGATTNGGPPPSSDWGYEDLQLLIKAVNLFPAGTSNRWDTVANWLNTHGLSKPRNSKQCLFKAKSLKESDLKKDANEMAYKKFKDDHLSTTCKPKGGEISERYGDEKVKEKKENTTTTNGNSVENGEEKVVEEKVVPEKVVPEKVVVKDGPRTWTNEEQKTLEQALRTFPNSTPQRWDKIAETLPGRTKKECMLRYKELVERIKAKKAMKS